MKLSYSTMRLLYECPHNYLNKISGIPQPDRPEFEEGRVAHRIIQAHLCGDAPREDLKHLNFSFPIVEKADFDPNTKFEVSFGEHIIFGFFDGLNREKGQLLEIKTSSSLWSLGKFKDSIQRKIYGWAMPELKEAILITSSRDPEKWKFQPPRAIRVLFTDEDRKDAENWILGAIAKITEGKFTEDLIDGECIDPRCEWGTSCIFKRGYGGF